MSTAFRQTHKSLLLQHLCFLGNGLKIRCSFNTKFCQNWRRICSTTLPWKLPSSCPQNGSRDSKKPCENSRSTRTSKSLSSRELTCKHKFCSILQKEGRSNPPLSVSWLPCRAMLRPESQSFHTEIAGKGRHRQVQWYRSMAPSIAASCTKSKLAKRLCYYRQIESDGVDG